MVHMAGAECSCVGSAGRAIDGPLPVHSDAVIGLQLANGPDSVMSGNSVCHEEEAA